MAAVQWDPQQYLHHADLRSRPFFELVDRIPGAPARVVDLGCGPGNTTATLPARWPDAHVVGVDNSAEMIEKARRDVGAVEFRLGDIAEYDPAVDAPDLIVSNAALQWVPGHTGLFPAWIDALPSGGVLAFQVPGNFDAPSHALLHDLRNSPRWAERVGGPHRAAAPEPGEYLDVLAGLGCTPDVWETTYHQVLEGERPVLDWMLGTGLRPVLGALTDPDERATFLAEYAALLDDAYPPRPYGTVLPFRRIFAVAVKRN
ncbi:methyltransferase domain-containing protein [Streptacidiphilus neutrinimicus]|uniref:methyltransferase domain-containing protein n=1 Tax=Streptacidiphilus neutrinimicus TaxID=105420 RepID=UPI0005A7AA1D|nr:methyltransferase domain-containing protein [Streptacidiphilus neutrinimicus]